MTAAVSASESTTSTPSVAQRIKVVSLLALYIAVSALLIRWNKYLMAKERFPHSAALSSGHMVASLLLCSVLYLLKPSLFPGMAATEGRRSQVLPWFVPLGMLFAVALYTSNQAYFYCNVAFLQFMKEGNVVISFVLSCAVGLQKFDRVKVAVVAWIVCGSLLCVTQDLQFVLLGAVIQIISQFAECSRAVMGEFVLNGASVKLDPLTYTLFGAPFCLLGLCAVTALTWDPKLPSDFAAWWPYLIPNACLAFVLNVLVATVIKECSAVGFMLSGLVKDIVLVVISAMAFHEPVTPLQYSSFTLVLCGILFWSLMKTSPEHPAVRTVERVLGVPQDTEAALAKAFMSKASVSSLASKEKV